MVNIILDIDVCIAEHLKKHGEEPKEIMLSPRSYNAYKEVIFRFPDITPCSKCTYRGIKIVCDRTMKDIIVK